VDRLLLSVAAAPLVFAACAFATRAPARRAAAALAGGAAFAAGNVAWDLLAHAAGWWSYRGVGGSGRGPLLWYAAAALSAAGVSLIGWRAWRRFGARGALAFLALFTLYGALRDFRVARVKESVIVFGPGPAPWIADAAGWLTLMALALAIQLALGGDARRLR
jgi:hypothetical protein